MATGLTRVRLSPNMMRSDAPSVLPVPDRVHRSVLDAIASTVRRGAVLTTAERNAVAYLARTPGYWDSITLSTAEVAWVRQLIDDPGGMSSDTVVRLFPEGGDVSRLVEMLNVAAQVRAVDTYCFAVGMRRLPLSHVDDEAAASSSQRDAAQSSRRDTAQSSQRDTAHSSLRDSWYGCNVDDADVAAAMAPLDRMTVEYVAALVSYLNESVIDLATHAGLLRLADTDATIPDDGLRLDRFRRGTVGVVDAELIAAFVRAGHDRDAHAMVDARVELAAKRGPDFAAGVASVHAAFELMNRLTLGVVAGLGPQLNRDQAQALWRQIAGTTNAPIAAGVSELGFRPQDLALGRPGN